MSRTLNLKAVRNARARPATSTKGSKSTGTGTKKCEFPVNWHPSDPKPVQGLPLQVSKSMIQVFLRL